MDVCMQGQGPLNQLRAMRKSYSFYQCQITLQFIFVLSMSIVGLEEICKIEHMIVDHQTVIANSGYGKNQ